MFSPRTLVAVLGAGNPRARLRATRDGQAAVRLHLGAAALATGVLDALHDAAATTPELARRLGAVEESLLEAFLRVLAAAGWVRSSGEGWSLTAGGRAAVTDDLVRASYEAFGGFHTGLYRQLPEQLAGGPARRDVVEQGAVIARISAAFEPFVDDVLRRTVAAVAPRTVLDVGCGAGLQLAAMLEAAPAAQGWGVEADAAAAALARRTLETRGLGRRAQVVEADVRDLPGQGTGTEFDLALLANVVYYVPEEERSDLLAGVARLLRPGGTLLVVTTVATGQLFSRHFDLLLRAQEGRMSLPDADGLVAVLTKAGLRPGTPRPIAPGAPLIAVTATRTD